MPHRKSYEFPRKIIITRCDGICDAHVAYVHDREKDGRVYNNLTTRVLLCLINSLGKAARRYRGRINQNADELGISGVRVRRAERGRMLCNDMLTHAIVVLKIQVCVKISESKGAKCGSI